MSDKKISFVLICGIENELQRDFYAEMCRVQHWSVRTLKKQLDGMLYERTALGKQPEKVIKTQLRAGGVVFLQESTFSANHISDYNPTIKDYFASLVKLGISRSVDFDIGQKLPTLCEEAGFQKIEHYEVEHHYSAKEVKLLVLPTIEEA